MKVRYGCKRIGFFAGCIATSLWGHVDGSAEAILRTARTAAESRDYAQALPLYDKLVGAHTHDADLLIEAARVHGFADRNGDAAALYRQALTVAPHRRGDILPSLGWQTLWSGDAGKAEQCFREILVTAQGTARVHALDGMAQALQAQNRHQDALVPLREAAGALRDDRRLQQRLAQSLFWTDQTEEAIQTWKALHVQAPQDRSIAWSLANAENFAGAHRSALVNFLQWPSPSHPRERTDVARAWRWAGFEDQAWPLLRDAQHPDDQWLRDYRVWREVSPFAQLQGRWSEDRDGLKIQSYLLEGGWHPRPGQTLTCQARWVQLNDSVGQPSAGHIQLAYGWRLGEATASTGTWWPMVALRSYRFPGWQPWALSAKVVGVPRDAYRVEGELTKEIIETPRAIAEKVSVDVLSLGMEYRGIARWLLAFSGAGLRFDDGTARLRLNGRLERKLLGTPRWTAGLETMAFWRGQAGTANYRGYWNPQRYGEARLYSTLAIERRPFDGYLRVGLGVSQEVDDASRRIAGHPHVWELGMNVDLTKRVRLQASAGASGQAMGMGGGGTGYWQRFLSVGVQGWF